MNTSVDWIIGIDPGKNGGWAYGNCKTRSIFGSKMPLSGGEIDVAPIAKRIADLEGSVLVVIEKVHAMPKQGTVSTFTFGCGYGKLIGMCQTLMIPHELVSPQSWKKIVLRDTKKDKDAAIEFIGRLYPDIVLIPAGSKKRHDGIAEAACLVHWGFKNL